MKFLMNIFFIIGLIYFNTGSKFELFKSELKSTSSQVQIVKMTSKNVTVTKPIVEEKLKQNIIDSIISNEMQRGYCDSKNCTINLKFEVSHNSGKLISLKESVNTMFRLPRDVKEINFFNYLIVGDELFEMKLKVTQDFKNRLKYLTKQIKNTQCNDWLNNDTQINLLVGKGVTYINLYNDEICNSNVKFELKSTDLEFRKIGKL